MIKKNVLYYLELESSNVLWYNFPSTSLIISVAIWTSGWRFCIWDNIHWIIVSQLHVFDDFPIIPPLEMTYLLLTLDRSFEFRGPHQEIADQGPKISTFTVVNGHSFTNARSGLLQ